MATTYDGDDVRENQVVCRKSENEAAEEIADPASKMDARAQEQEPDDAENKVPDAGKFPVVGIGASAGGLEALKTFFSKVSENSGMAYIVLIHMKADQPSVLPELLQKTTPIPVSAAKDGEAIEPNRVYTVPPDKEIKSFNGRIQLSDIVKKGAKLPINLFFRSLSQDQESNAVAVVLSGTGTDGSMGIREIKSKDGLVLVQSEESAKYDGMPRSAIGTGVADAVLPAEEMPEMLERLFMRHPAKLHRKTTEDGGDKKDWLNKICTVIRNEVGHDFSLYKTNTILRRIGRRMNLNQIDIEQKYLRFMQENPAETKTLFKELLIGVTNFFRDPESFEVLKKKVLPEILASLKKGETFRAWVPGCSTDEEVYSLAMILKECMEEKSVSAEIQLFGTDVDARAIEKAREGLYPASIATDVHDSHSTPQYSISCHFSEAP